MLLRDLLVALPGLVGPTNSASRVEEVPPPSQVVVPTVAAPKDDTSVEPTFDTSSAFYEKAKQDFYGKTGYTTPTEPAEHLDISSSLPGSNLVAEAGRVLNIDPEGGDQIASIRILTQANHGHVSVNPDKSLSLVLSEDPTNTTDTAFRYEITYENGSTKEIEAKVDVKAGQEAEGWGKGDFYMLEIGTDGRVIVEHGENHRKIYVTEGTHGLTRAEIARTEGISASKITVQWLKDHPEYGATPEQALATDLGMELWYATTGRNVDPNSNWLLFERGYEYENLGRIVSRGTAGESALNPVLIGAYGEGTDPKIGDGINIFQDKISHVVVQSLDFSGFQALTGENLLLDGISVKKDLLNAQNITRFTVRNSDIVDVVQSEPVTADKVWQASPNRISGAFLSKIDGAYLDHNLFDRNGWEEGYDYNLSSSAPMPPSYYNHNLYVQTSVRDVTVHDNIFMRGASFGAQIRPGGMIEGNVFIDNNAALNFFSGANYTLALNNLVTSAGHKKVAHYEGALAWGIDNQAKQASLIGNIITHLADPNNAAEKAEKATGAKALSRGPEDYFNDTLIYNWAKASAPSSANRNVEGLSTDALDQTTIQIFAAELLGKKTATISDLGDYLRAQADGHLDQAVDADIINAFFRKSFGFDTTVRAEADTLSFVPDDRGEGMRWDSRLNWSTEDLPGMQNGDSVDLGGNRVLFGAETATIDNFIFGEFGQLKASSGKLTIDGAIETSTTGNLLQITNAGQVWIDGYRDSNLLEIKLTGGRFANTGGFAGETAITATGDAQLLLATAGARFDLSASSNLSITGSKAKVGFDGGDGQTATLQLHADASLSFTADTTSFGKISEFYSGAFDTSDVTSGVHLGGDLDIDLSAVDPKAGGTWTLIDADQIIGLFDDIAVAGLGRNQDALIRVDYVQDQVVLLVGEAGKGSGQIRASTSGDADFINYTTEASLRSLWEDLHATIQPSTDDPI